MKRDPVTPETLFLNRRLFLRGSIFAGSALATTGAYRYFRPAIAGVDAKGDAPTPLETVRHYNNFYEFSTDKDAVAAKAEHFHPQTWGLEINGLVDAPLTLDLAALASLPVEERVYRFRCVEGWSMVVPWQGVTLASLLERARPSREAKFVAFTSYYSEKDMPEASASGLEFPYREGLRLDEAMHDLTLLATGLYGKPLAPQNGAPVRLVVPWKYGFKSCKSIVRIDLVREMPATTWNQANPREYGFYSNVNPAVDHPRWSQARERRLGERATRETLAFNGYAREVQHLYDGMDLKENF